MPFVTQKPQDDVDYSFDWSDFLDEVGSPSDTINSSAWSVTPDVGGSPSPNLHDDTTTNNVTSVFIQDLMFGVIYTLVNRIVTGQGRTRRRAFTIRCE